MRKVLLTIVVVLVVILGGGAFWVYLEGEETVRSAVERHGPEVLGAPVQLADVDFSPFSGTAALGGLTIGNPEGFSEAEALAFERFTLAIEPMSLFADLIEVRDIHIESPRLRVEPGRGGTNLQALQRNVEAFTGPQEETETAPTPVHIGRFRLTGAEIVVGSGPIGFSDRTLALADIELENIGGAEGVPPSEALQLVFDALMPQVQRALQSAAGQQLLGEARERIGNLEGEAREAVEGAVGGARDRLEEEAGKLTGEAGEAGKAAEDAVRKGLGGLLGGKEEEEKKDDGGNDGGGG